MGDTGDDGPVISWHAMRRQWAVLSNRVPSPAHTNSYWNDPSWNPMVNTETESREMKSPKEKSQPEKESVALRPRAVRFSLTAEDASAAEGKWKERPGKRHQRSTQRHPAPTPCSVIHWSIHWSATTMKSEILLAVECNWIRANATINSHGDKRGIQNGWMNI